jgi:hypothetical protein
MAEPGDIGISVYAFPVSDWEIDDLQVQFVSAKYEIEISKGIKFTKE